MLSLLDGLGNVLAIFQTDHSSASSWKIAESFIDSTNKAAVSDKALSLRLCSRSSALMRPCGARLCWGRARTSSGLARAWIAA